MGTFDDFFLADGTHYFGYAAYTDTVTHQQGYEYCLVAYCNKCGVYGSNFVHGPTENNPYILPSRVSPSPIQTSGHQCIEAG